MSKQTRQKRRSTTRGNRILTMPQMRKLIRQTFRESGWTTAMTTALRKEIRSGTAFVESWNRKDD